MEATDLAATWTRPGGLWGSNKVGKGDGLGITSGRLAGTPPSPPPRVVDLKNVKDVVLSHTVACSPAGRPTQ